MIERLRGTEVSFQAMLGSVAIYCILGAISISTAYVQTNAAAVWMPSGFAVGLLTVLGLRFWPVIAIGAFVVNIGINFVEAPQLAPVAAIALAASITVGNTAEALLGAWIVRRYAGGAEFLWQPRYIMSFVTLAVSSAPLLSMAVGVSASFAAGIPARGSLGEIMLTWYIADAVGILIFASLTVLLMTETKFRAAVRDAFEATLLAFSIVVAGQAMNGITLGKWLTGWPKGYMVIPVLLWATFRFGVRGALFSIVLVLLVSVAGTMRGFAAFPADDPSRSLIYLQVFLGLLTAMTLSIAAALSETDRLRASLEDTVRVRTRGLEGLLREREILTTLVAHDLQSPLYGIRNAIRAVSDAVAGQRIAPAEIVATMTIVEETCSTIADRVTALLSTEQNNAGVAYCETDRTIGDILTDIETVHDLALRSRSVALDIKGDVAVEVEHPAQIEHVLDILIDNAIKYSPRGGIVSIAAHRVGTDIEVSVADTGAGVDPDHVDALFRPRSHSAPRTTQAGAGLGLYLAREQVSRLGGYLSFSPAEGGGALFCLTLPLGNRDRTGGADLSRALPKRHASAHPPVGQL